MSSKFQQEFCEFSDDPLNPERPTCGKPATHWSIQGDPDPDMREPFPLCDEHWAMEWRDRELGEMSPEERERSMSPEERERWQKAEREFPEAERRYEASVAAGEPQLARAKDVRHDMPEIPIPANIPDDTRVAIYAKPRPAHWTPRGWTQKKERAFQKWLAQGAPGFVAVGGTTSSDSPEARELFNSMVEDIAREKNSQGRVLKIDRKQGEPPEILESPGPRSTLRWSAVPFTPRGF